MNLLLNIKKSITGIGLLALITIILSSCHKEVSVNNQIGSTVTVNYRQAFEDYWKNMNKTYVFWSIDPTNWDDIHATYAPLFSGLDEKSAADPYFNSDSVAYIYYKSIADGLIDSHYTLFINHPFGNFIPTPLIRPSFDRKIKNPQFIENLFDSSQLFPDNPNTSNYYTITVDTQPKYLSNIVVGIDTIYPVPPMQEFVTVVGYIKNTNILYFSFNEFRLEYELYYGNASASNAIQAFFDELNVNSNNSGLIIDVRGNGGGYISDLNLLVGRLTSTPIKVGASRSKNGNGRLDYTPWADAVVNPWILNTNPNNYLQNTRPFNKNTPIVVLADGESVSMSEMTTMSIKALPNPSYFVGDTTWGANGPLTSNSDFSTGSFNFGNSGTGPLSLPNYYGTVYTSSCMFRNLNGKIYEGKGFPPDIEVKVTPSMVYPSKGVMVDPQLEKAISLLPK